MHENRKNYPAKKTQMYQTLQEMPKKYPVCALIKMDKVRSSQILPLRKKLKNDVEFVSIKDSVAKKALEKLDIPGIKGMIDHLSGQCMLLFTNMSPFKLNVLLAKNKIMMYARGEDIASVDIKIPAKNTGIAPGPMLTEFKEAGIPTKIDQGTIWIAKDSVPVQKGGVISDKLATLLQKLDIKAVEAGIALYSALEKGLVYKREELVIDVEAIRNEIAKAHQEAVSLSIEAAYITKDNVGQILAKAAQYARSLSIESGFLTADTKEQILQKAYAQAKSVAGKAKGYSAS